MFHVPNQCRIRNHQLLPSDDSFGNNGLFKVEHYKIYNYYFFIQASDGMGWEHVSVSLFTKKHAVQRCPTWEEMCWIKDMFWDEDDCVIQYHPAKSEYVNLHPFVLHLWKPIGQFLPIPPKIMVG